MLTVLCHWWKCRKQVINPFMGGNGIYCSMLCFKQETEEHLRMLTGISSVKEQQTACGSAKPVENGALKGQ